MYSKTTSIIILLFLLILNNGQFNYCNCNIALKSPTIEGLRVLSEPDGFKKLVFATTLYTEQKIDIKKIRPFISFLIIECENGTVDSIFEFQVKKHEFELCAFIPNKKTRSNLITMINSSSKEYGLITMFNSKLYLSEDTIKAGLKKSFEKCQKNISDKRNFGFKFVVRYEYICETSQQQELSVVIESGELKNWMSGMLLSLNNKSIKLQKKPPLVFKFSFVKDYTDKQNGNTMENVSINLQKPCTSDFLPRNGNYNDVGDEIITETRLKQDRNAHTKRPPEFFLDSDYRTSETDNEYNRHSDSLRNDNTNTSASQGSMGIGDMKSQNNENTNLNGESVGSTDTVFIDRTPSKNIEDLDNNSQSTGATATGTGNSGTYTGTGNTGNNENNSEKPPEEPPKKPPKKSKIVKIIGIVVLSIVLIGVIVYFYFIIKRLYFTKKEVEYVY